VHTNLISSIAWSTTAVVFSGTEVMVVLVVAEEHREKKNHEYPLIWSKIGAKGIRQEKHAISGDELTAE
jgi:hypothetical protein